MTMNGCRCCYAAVVRSGHVIVNVSRCWLVAVLGRVTRRRHMIGSGIPDWHMEGNMELESVTTSSEHFSDLDDDDDERNFQPAESGYRLLIPLLIATASQEHPPIARSSNYHVFDGRHRMRRDETIT